MTKTPVNHGRAKHIDLKYHIRDEVKRGLVQVNYQQTETMLADIMTKGLAGPRHSDLTKLLGVAACPRFEYAARHSFAHVVQVMRVHLKHVMMCSRCWISAQVLKTLVS
ncbi:TPA: hypothetical protein N0F65_004294 [Lagenidium giganteum]|uniref:Uncharacterized protein n=1 Tax=Lagenidium giganteum TaxID=4803 RepID=A0AAV2ZD07_9STRA|nr:TPA: hypothetical protein N0F65_004294 [Lagenidium giganteum]